MKIISITMAYNEADVLSLFVRHHSRFIDHMIIILHGESIDDTETVVYELQSEGFPITILHSTIPAFCQSEIITDALHQSLIDHNPDIVLPLDCDEFLSTALGKSTREILITLPADTISLLPWRTFIPKTTSDSWLGSMTHRRRQEMPEYSKVVIPRKFLCPTLRVSQGSHAVFLDSQPVTAARNDTLWLSHVPVRTIEQIRRKGLLSWPRQRDNPYYKHGEVFQWQHIYHRVIAQKDCTQDDLVEIASQYACSSYDVCPVCMPDLFEQYLLS